jgi:hypothetical protein
MSSKLVSPPPLQLAGTWANQSPPASRECSPNKTQGIRSNCGTGQCQGVTGIPYGTADLSKPLTRPF